MNFYRKKKETIKMLYVYVKGGQLKEELKKLLRKTRKIAKSILQSKGSI